MMNIAYQSDIGRYREVNQDFVGTFVNKLGYKFAVVADGVGGQAAGDVASAMAVLHLGNQWELSSIGSLAAAREWLINQVKAENAAILEASERFRDLRGMATTLVSVMIFNDEILFANIGDSRGYVLHNGEFKQLTIDHSLVNELILTGQISEEDAKLHPNRNVITRWLGVNDEAMLDMTTYRAKVGDIIMLSTDGLTKSVSDKEIKQLLQSKESLQDKVASLITQANEAGGRDNITVLLIAREAEVN